ncbi:Fic family protein [Faecalicoccus pleomorphus]|uniref:Fic family protein n=2 Tax=Faecalicoccus pleomorphus TaxID=1323 RepID=UPI00232BE216|nr:Fic family protein [Faecalicoccus pleomorphus]MDB7987482.1 Fic family protein [Faecalicoccus pleomorphus]MDB7991545.1 Fic family protein [Faecalicoccus pleomorphus]
MEIAKFLEILHDKKFIDYNKMSNKYTDTFHEYLDTLSMFYTKLPLEDAQGNFMVFLEGPLKIQTSTLRTLFQNQSGLYSAKSLETEIIATSAIENIDFSRDSVRSILSGQASKNEEEKRIEGLKKGLEFIADPGNKITEENLYKLYKMAIGQYLDEENQLKEGNLYRHDSVYVVGTKVEHTGMSYKQVLSYMKSLVTYINQKDDIQDLMKACIIHFYIAYVHPWFDGNGRMARLVHLWFLVQRGYQSVLFVPFSSLIEKTRKQYYDAYQTIEDNYRYTHTIDVTPFLLYFINNVYNKIEQPLQEDTLSVYRLALNQKKITNKEDKLWKFVLSYFGTEEFSTKGLEKAYGDAAYATIRSFVLKFTDLGLLTAISYTTKNKYRVKR